MSETVFHEAEPLQPMLFKRIEQTSANLAVHYHPGFVVGIEKEGDVQDEEFLLERRHRSDGGRRHFKRSRLYLSERFLFRAKLAVGEYLDHHIAFRLRFDILFHDVEADRLGMRQRVAG